MVSQSNRKTMLAAMNYLLLEQTKVHYPPIENGQIIRQQELHNIVTLPQLHNQVNSKHGFIGDCSQTSQVIIQVGLGRRIASYDVTTEWFLDNLPHYHDPSAAYIGGPVVYGSDPGHHMSLVHTRGKNPILISHGSNPIKLVSLSTEIIWQANRPWTFTSIAGL
ncbi:MAG: hypothetical protein ACHQ1H_12225 [Nitrososphaerales archaeon]